MKFSKSKVCYASHQLSLYHGECPHRCDYCFNGIYRQLSWKWAVGELRLNEKAFDLAEKAETKGVESLVVSFTNDPLPYFECEDKQEETLTRLIDLLDILEKRKIRTKVLTKNPLVSLIRLERDPYEHVKLGISVTTNRDNNCMVETYESGTHGTISDRLASLLILKDCEFDTWGSGEPPLPGTDVDLWLQEIVNTGVSEVWIGKGSYKAYLSNAFNWNRFTAQVLEFKEKNERGDVVQLKPELDKHIKYIKTNPTILDAFGLQSSKA